MENIGYQIVGGTPLKLLLVQTVSQKPFDIPHEIRDIPWPVTS